MVKNSSFSFLTFFIFYRVVFINHNVDMDVAVTGMTESEDDNTKFLGQFFSKINKLMNL